MKSNGKKQKGKVTPYANIRPLTEQEKAFCDNYYNNMMSGVDSVINAGYFAGAENNKKRELASKLASQLLVRPAISNYCLMTYGVSHNPNPKFVEKFQEKHARDSIERIDKGKELYGYIVDKLKRIIDINVPDDHITKEELIENKEILKYNFGAAISATSELCKIHGFYAPVKNLNVNISNSPEMKRLMSISAKLMAEAKNSNEKII